jgi:hypothetical protein
LRYAYAEFGPFRLGQAASTFMDYDVFPNVLDYQGPDGMVLMRQVIARVTLPPGDNWHLAFAADQPYSDIRVGCCHADLEGNQIPCFLPQHGPALK